MTDILFYMSDQHSYARQHWAGDEVLRTPMLDRLAAEGTAFTAANTACPLCVPARAAMISGQLPSNNGVLFNFNAISSDKATFLHSLTVAGYETVLCGRMHFVGPDQRHGFSRRVAGDRTPVFHNMVQDKPRIRGFDENSSVHYIGRGDSPVLAYDRYVVEHALDFLREDHERPLFLTVGTYGPHFPYVAPPELYDYYYDRVKLDDVRAAAWEHPALKGKMQELDPEVVRAARAAYYALVEQQDRHIETVWTAFQEYLRRSGHDGIFVYVSDHGDMNGQKGYFGKQVFYEPSLHIPFLIQGSGIPAGQRITSPVILLDVGPTLCELAGADILPGDGKSLASLIRGETTDDERMVVAEQYTYLADGGTSLGRAVRWRNWKFFTYSGFPDSDALFDLDADPEERVNRLADEPEIAARLRAAANAGKSYDEVMVHEDWVTGQLYYLLKCDFDDPVERWHCPEDMEVLSEPIHSKRPFSPTPWAKHMRARIESMGKRC